MLKPKAFEHVGIIVTDMERSLRFYPTVSGWGCCAAAAPAARASQRSRPATRNSTSSAIRTWSAETRRSGSTIFACHGLCRDRRSDRGAARGRNSSSPAGQ
jgi:hypothetical protein